MKLSKEVVFIFEIGVGRSIDGEASFSHEEL